MYNFVHIPFFRNNGADYFLNRRLSLGSPSSSLLHLLFSSVFCLAFSPVLTFLCSLSFPPFDFALFLLAQQSAPPLNTNSWVRPPVVGGVGVPKWVVFWGSEGRYCVEGFSTLLPSRPGPLGAGRVSSSSPRPRLGGAPWSGRPPPPSPSPLGLGFGAGPACLPAGRFVG